MQAALLEQLHLLISLDQVCLSHHCRQDSAPVTAEVIKQGKKVMLVQTFDTLLCLAVFT